MSKKAEKVKLIGLIEFIELYNTEEKCRDYLFARRFADGFICPKCGCKEYYCLPKRALHQCKSCGLQTSVTSGTIFHKTKIPLTKWFLAIYLMAEDKRGFSAKRLQKELKISYKSAWYLLMRLRTAMGKRDSKYFLQELVELDDSYFGGSKKNSKRGRGTDKTPVVIAVSKNSRGCPKFIAMEAVPNLQQETIGDFAVRNIEMGATIETDGYRSYLKPLSENFNHIHEVFDEASRNLHWLHTIISNAKAFINGTYHGLDKKHLQLYLNEFCFRFNRRYFTGGIFDRLVTAAAAAPKITLAELK